MTRSHYEHGLPCRWIDTLSPRRHDAGGRSGEWRGSWCPMTGSEVRYVNSGGVHIAYRVFGDGPVDLILVPAFTSHLEQNHEWPGVVRWNAAAGVVLPADRVRQAQYRTLRSRARTGRSRGHHAGCPGGHGRHRGRAPRRHRRPRGRGPERLVRRHPSRTHPGPDPVRAPDQRFWQRRLPLGVGARAAGHVRRAAIGCLGERPHGQDCWRAWWRPASPTTSGSSSSWPRRCAAASVRELPRPGCG